MTDETGRVVSGSPERRKVNVWMIVAIGAIVLALIAGYFAFSYMQQVEDWEAAAEDTVAKLEAAGVELRSTIESGVAGYEEQISDLTAALEQSQTEAGTSSAQLEEAEQQAADAQADLEATQQELEAVTNELEQTQAALDDANAKLAQVGELVLPDGSYVGPVLAARTEPFPAIIFQDDTAWRVAEVAPDVQITVGEQTLALVDFSALLQSSEPDTAELANGDYEVVVEKGLVQSITAVVAG
jgi:septal ring factor EnvC (AmiA/AmiB activator)